MDISSSLVHKDIRHINKGKNKTIYVYFVKQKLLALMMGNIRKAFA